MNLGKKYKQLFEGKIRSNDAALLTESNLLDDIAYSLKTNSVLKQLGIEPKDIEKEKDDYTLRLRFYPDPKDLEKGPEKLKKEYETALKKELLKLVGKDYMSILQVNVYDNQPDYAGIEMSITDISKTDTNLRVKVLKHYETSTDAIDFEGTINGKPWTASKEYMRDGAIFTSVYDTPTQDTIEEDDPEYDAIITAIDDYMEKKNLAK